VSIVIVSLMLIYLFASTIQWRHKIWLPMEWYRSIQLCRSYIKWTISNGYSILR
jgi:hypothetical protein